MTLRRCVVGMKDVMNWTKTIIEKRGVVKGMVKIAKGKKNEQVNV